MIDFIAGVPAWLLDHRWWIGLGTVGLMVGLAAPILLNPRGRQLREILRRRK